MLAADVALLAALDLRFPPADWARPLLYGGLLLALALVYHRRGIDRFQQALLGLLALVWYSAAYAVLMYAVAALARPLQDEALARWDAALGFHLPDLVAWMSAHPWFHAAIAVCYDSLLLQTGAVLALLALTGRRVALERFLLRFTLASLLTIAVFAVWPVMGPMAAYDYPLTAGQQTYVDHHQAMRAGTMREVSWRGAQGLISQPSFHTVWAILLALAFGAVPRLRWPAALVNAGAVFGTVGLGWHYLSDIGGGLVVTLVAWAVVRWAEPRWSEARSP